MSGKVEVPIRLIIVVKNKNCQSYLCVFPVFPSSPLSRRFSIFNKLSFHFPRHLQHGLVLFKTNLGHVEDDEESEMRAY